jgi:DNA invertase Pin-like site-specific DNA recombinase
MGVELIGLVRVSTDKQKESGLGLDAQLAAIEDYRRKTSGELLDVYEEVESGKHNDITKRPRLQLAVEHALEADAILVIAKLDRLVRSTSVMQYLKDKNVKFVACDNPYANELTIDILVAVAANEARMISRRTKDALEAYKASRRVSKRVRAMHPEGVPQEIEEATAGKLGASLPQCRNLTTEARRYGVVRSAAARRASALESANALARMINAWKEAEPDLTLQAIADRLNAKKRRTPRKSPKGWTPTQVKRVLDRAAGDS